uniref:ZP domain-containing protein n=1 Tax=Ascaris lumbricoides TaxID=6252 RepID=A0A0M3IRQ3_ASCLU
MEADKTVNQQIEKFQFLTKVDRVYNIQCFYMEADKTVNQQIEVAELATALVSMFLPMPICRYEILSGGPDGTPVFFAIVGQQVYHKWTCDSEYQDTFCMVVHSCIVDDGRGKQVEMIDANGCAIDKHVLANLDYPTDLMAAQEAHVFKYADRTALFFQCQISVTLKEKGTSCTRPSCREPARQKRYSFHISFAFFIEGRGDPLNPRNNFKALREVHSGLSSSIQF